MDKAKFLKQRFLGLLAIEGFTVALVLLALVIFLSIASPFFLTLSNIENVLVQSVFVLFVALGVTFALMSGGIDLSVGSVLGLSGGIAVYVLLTGAPAVFAIAAGLATGAVIGLINGLVITRFGLADFIVTLAMLGIVAGGLRILAGQVDLQAPESETFQYLANGSVAGIPTLVLFAVGTLLILSLVLRRSSFGRCVLAIGMNRQAAHLSGINVDRVRVQVYVLSGLCAAIAGILLASYLSSVQPALGTGYELTAIAAAVIGGTALAGGRGTVWGTAVGALLLGVIGNGLRLLEVNASWFEIVTGAIIVFAVVLDRMLQRVSRMQSTK